MKQNSLLLLTLASAIPAALLAQDARITIDLALAHRAGDQVRPAASSNRAAVGDSIAFYARPRAQTVFYIVESDGKTAVLVHRATGRPGQKLRLPGRDAIALKKGERTFAFVAAPRPLARLEELFGEGSAPSAEWETLRNELETSGSIDLGDSTDKPAPLAANVRGVSPEAPGGAGDQAFFARMKPYSGRGLLLKTYRFRVD